jgi:hypothetical protein
MTNPPIEPRTFHNNFLLVLLVFLFALFAEFLAICMVFETIDLVAVQHGAPVMRWVAGLQWAAGAYGFAYMGYSLWGIARMARFVYVKFDANGMHWRLGHPRHPEEISMAWDQVSEIRKQIVGSTCLIDVIGKDGSWACYSPYTFFRYMKLARLISACAAVPITVLPRVIVAKKTAKPTPAQP